MFYVGIDVRVIIIHAYFQFLPTELFQMISHQNNKIPAAIRLHVLCFLENQ
jgi:hypothetical protein